MNRTGMEPLLGVAVVDIWSFETEQPMKSLDLTGYSVEATDGKIGKVDEATYEPGGSYLIVDTGPWIFGNKTVILPAGIVERVDEKTETVIVNRPKEEIANAPAYDEKRGHREQNGGDPIHMWRRLTGNTQSEVMAGLARYRSEMSTFTVTTSRSGTVTSRARRSRPASR